VWLGNSDVDVIRRDESEYVDGVWDEREPAGFKLENVSVQPLTDEDMVLLEQAGYTTGKHKMYVGPTKPELRTINPDFVEEPEGEKFQPDLVRYRGRIYTVFAFRAYPDGFFRHRRYALLQQQTSEVPA
jgi:hypothetical protein